MLQSSSLSLSLSLSSRRGLLHHVTTAQAVLLLAVWGLLGLYPSLISGLRCVPKYPAYPSFAAMSWPPIQESWFHAWGFPKIGGPQYSTLNSRILILRYPYFSETPTCSCFPFADSLCCETLLRPLGCGLKSPDACPH